MAQRARHLSTDIRSRGEHFVEKASQQSCLRSPTQAGLLVRINPETMPGDEVITVGACITIRHGESVIALPAGSSVEAVTDLVKVLNRHV